MCERERERERERESKHMCLGGSSVSSQSFQTFANGKKEVPI